MAKTTTLVSQLNKVEAERQAQEAAEDRELATRSVPEGKVWVRLIRPHYDANGVLHEPGVVALDPAAVPKSAKVLTKKQAAAVAKSE